MESKCEIGIDKFGRPVGISKLFCKGCQFTAQDTLFDTGASICHMSYPMWLRMGLNDICWNDNSSLLKSMGILSSADMDFDRLPFTAKRTILGNNTVVKAYEFKLDKLILGQKSMKFPYCIELDDITVRLINAYEVSFVVGCNVLKHLKICYNPTLYRHEYFFEMTQDSLQSLQYDRDHHISNYYRHTFNYL
jgi:hypothetical protein